MRFRLRPALLPFALALAPACSSPSPADGGSDVASDLGESADTAPTDAATDADVPDPHGGLRLPRCEDTEPADAAVLAPVASTLLGTVEPVALRVMTPDQSANPVLESAELMYRARGFDQYLRGPAQDRVVRTDLGGSAPAGGTRRSLAYFVQASDYQFVDDESPSRLALLDTTGASGAIRPQEAYLARYASAMNRTLAALARPERPFQFGLFAGDCSDSAQYNELRWFLQLMNGEPAMHVDSGDDDDPVPGPDNDPKDPFDPAGFPAPWYFVPGNHDVEVVGVTAPDDARRAQAIGASAPTGTRDYTRWYAPPVRGRVVADPNRRLLDRAAIVQQLQTGAATPGPVGHGFAANTDVSLGANYTADVIPGLLRVIALDTSDDSGGSPGLVHQRVLDQWLRPQLERAQGDGVLVMLASHHPTDSIDQLSGEFGAPVADAVDPRAIEQLVASYPNVIAWLVGHQHDVRVRAIRGADAQHPGYWEVQSGSIADWPNQARVLELVDNGNGTLSLFGTMIDAELASCMERRYRRLALMDHLAAWDTDHTGTAQDRNVELVIPIPAAAAAAVSAAGASAPTTLESETTLRAAP